MDVASVLRAPGPPGLPPAARAPTISVLVPAFNTASTIADALESVLAQQPPVEEIIVSDDGSEDDLDAVLVPYRDRIAVVRGPNAGLATARNRAAAVARGTLLALLDADDVWLPGRTEALTEAARLRPDLDIITTDAFVVRDGRRRDGTYYGRRSWPTGDQVDAIVRSNFIFGAAAIRRDAFLTAGGYDATARFAEDWDLWLRMLAAGRRAGLVALPLYEYRRRPESLTRQRVDLALGVMGALARAQGLPLSPEQQGRLARTEGEWRVRGALDALATRDPRRWRLAARALAGRSVAGRDRAKVLAGVLLGSRRR